VSAQTLSLDSALPRIRGLVFSGGGSKGLIYPGVIKALEDSALLGGVKCVAGSSSGAMTALCIALGFDAEGLRDIQDNQMRFSELLDLKPRWVKGRLTLRDDGEKSIAFMENLARQRLKIYFNEKAILTESDYLNEYGVDKAPYYQEQLHFFEAFIDQKADRGFTFRDLAALRELLKPLHRHCIKSLYITGTSIKRRKTVTFSLEETSHLSIAVAAQASGAHPLIFQPRYIEGIGSIVDGGLTDNLPVKLLEKYLDPDPDSISLCFLLGGKEKPLHHRAKHNRVIVLEVGNLTAMAGILNKGEHIPYEREAAREKAYQKVLEYCQGFSM
jgi:predicted acylesterase/phospholipase RssA